MNNTQKLIKKIFELAQATDTKLEKSDTAMDCTVAMNKNQRSDLLAMIAYAEQKGEPADRILSNVLHDCYGLRSAHLGRPSGNYFSPRSHGYAKKLKAVRAA